MALLRNFILVLFLQFTQSVFSVEGEVPTVQSSLGKIQGSHMTSDGGIQFFAFRGIPFAKPPVKKLRFKDPELLTEPWAGVLDATEEGPICIQYDILNNQLTGDEDCLYLNVYTPKTEGQTFTDALPVMVYIHGGAFFAGTGASSLLGPQRLMDKPGVILVTINYRLGPFGFLTTLDENSPGNYGMMDQVIALKWVREHITAFGGDPNRVTLFGESAGSGSVGLHLWSPLSKGLFNAAIAQSGSALSDWVAYSDNNKALKDAKNLAARLKCPIDDHEAMMKCLTKLPSLDLVVKSTELIKESLKKDCMLIVFQPVVDTARGSNAFLPDHPRNLVANKQPNVATIMTGVTKDEGILFIDVCVEGKISTYPKRKLPDVLKAFEPSLYQNEQQWKTMSQEVISPYFRDIDESDAAQRTVALNNFFSDSFINFKVDVLNELIAKHNVPVYVYKFTHRGKYSISANAPEDMVCHADELQYLFRCGYFKSTTLLDRDRNMADIMVTLWTNFAKTKMPSLNGSLSEHPDFKWEPMTVNNIIHLDLNLTPTMTDGRLSVNYNQWENVSSGYDKDEL